MAFQMPYFLLPSLVYLLFLFSSLKKSFAIQTTWKDTQSHHLFHLKSLLPSSSCSSSTKGPKREASLEVVHKHGPCSHLNNKNGKTEIPHNDILSLDKERVKYIHSKIISENNKMEESSSSSGSADLPAMSGSVLETLNYFVVLGLGTPKRDLSLLFDTGSDLTWTQCQPCAKSCYKQKDIIFDPSKSSSYSNISCTSPECTQLSSATGKKPGCSKSTNACIYVIQYGDQSFSVGDFSRERLTVTPTNIVDNFLFGCGQYNDGLYGRSAGLLGLDRNQISFVQQTSLKYHKTFSYCLPSTTSATGYLTFGVVANRHVKYTPFSTSGSTTFYGLDINGITVGGKNLPISSSTFSSGGAIIDSGTVITRLPPTTYAILRDTFKKGMSKYPNVTGVSILDTCYDLSAYEVVSIPKISFLLGGGVAVDLAASGSLYVASLKQVCLAFAPNGDDSDVTIFGNVQQKTLEVVYDVGGGKLGFAPGGCK